MAQAGLTVEFQTALNPEGFQKGLNKIQERILDIPAQNIAASLPNVDTGNLQRSIDLLMAQGNLLDTITVKTKTFTTESGQSYTAVVGASARYLDALNNIGTAQIKVTNQLDIYDEKKSKYDALTKKAIDWGTRAENMNAKEGGAIKESSSKLLEKIALYQKLGNEGNIAEANKLIPAIEDEAIALEKSIAASKRAGEGARSFGQRLSDAMKNLVAYAGAAQVLRKAINELNKAIKFTIDLNTEMTKIQVLQAEGAQTSEEIRNLASAYNDLAKELGATTIEIAQGSVEWLRQGKTIQETTKLLTASTQMAKLGNLSAAESTEYLTSVLNGFNIEAEKASSVVDKLVAVDNVAATSTAELATALRYSSAVANQTGVSLEQLISYVAVVSETTRQNAESIGQGFKTMLTRMQDIKAGAIDEDGLGINNVEIALKRVDVKLRDSESEFRDFGSVLEELAGKWDTLTEVEQANISKAIAGVRQANMFNILMQNMGRALELQQVEMNSAGLAASRYRKYMESLQAKITQFKATLEGLYQDAIRSGFIASIVDAGTKILEFIDKIGGLKTAIAALGIVIAVPKVMSYLKAFKKEFGIGLPEAIGKTAASMFHLGKTTTASMALATAGITALISALVAFGIAVERAIVTQKEYYELMKESEQEIPKREDEIKSVKELKEEYIRLNERIKDETLSQNEHNIALARWYEVQSQIREILPAVNGYLDAQGRFIIANSDAIDTQITKLEDYNEQQKELLKIYAQQILFKYSFTEESESLAEGLTRGLETAAKAVQNILGAIGIDKNIPFLELIGEPQFRTPDTEGLEKAYEAYDKAIASGNEEEKAKQYENLQNTIVMYNEALSQAGSEAAEEFLSGFSEGFRKKHFEVIKSYEDLIAEMKAGAEKAAAEAAAEADVIARLKQAKYTDKQIEGYKKAGIGGDLTEYLLDVELPKMKEALSSFKTAWDASMQGLSIDEKLKAQLESLGVLIKTDADGTRHFYATLEDGSEKSINSVEDFIAVLVELTRQGFPTTEFQDGLVETELAAAETTLEFNNLYNATKNVSDAQKEYADNGYVSAETAYELISANNELASSLIATEDGFIFNKDAAIQTMQAQVALQLEELNLGNIAEYVRQGMYNQAAAMLAAGSAALATAADIAPLISTLSLLAQLSGATSGLVGGGGGGGGGRKEDPRIKETEELIEDLEDEIDLYEKQKDAIKEAQDQYHDWIDAKKESLKLTKEENDYLKEQQKKANNLSDIRTQIETLALDNSEEARAKRLELESQAAELEEEITADSEDRKYDMQIQALEDLQDAYDKMIENQIKGIDEVIDKIKEQIDAYRELIEQLREAQQGGGGGGGGISSVFSNVVKELQIFAKNLAEAEKSPQLFKLAVEDIARILDEEIAAAYENHNTELATKLETMRAQIDEATADNVLTQEEIKSLTTTLTTEFGSLPEEIRQKIADSLKTTLTIDLKVYFRAPTTGTASLPYPSIPSSRIPTNKMPPPGTGSIYAPHSGGLIEEHHAGNFAGNLNSNEVFAKLLKGEYVATEGQMDKFLRQTMPAITNAAVNKSAPGASISVNMPITVEGNLDKEVIPDIDKIADKVVNTITKTLTKKGYIRPANLTVS